MRNDTGPPTVPPKTFRSKCGSVGVRVLVEEVILGIELIVAQEIVGAAMEWLVPERVITLTMVEPEIPYSALKFVCVP